MICLFVADSPVRGSGSKLTHDTAAPGVFDVTASEAINDQFKLGTAPMIEHEQGKN